MAPQFARYVFLLYLQAIETAFHWKSNVYDGQSASTLSQPGVFQVCHEVSGLLASLHPKDLPIDLSAVFSFAERH